MHVSFIIIFLVAPTADFSDYSTTMVLLLFFFNFSQSKASACGKVITYLCLASLIIVCILHTTLMHINGANILILWYPLIILVLYVVVLVAKSSVL